VPKVGIMPWKSPPPNPYRYLDPPAGATHSLFAYLAAGPLLTIEIEGPRST
jgi:hypothetical protein